MEERLQKLLSAGGIASRREAENMIQAGRVTVNGKVAELGMKADPLTADIRVDGRPLAHQEQRVYIMLNKPRGYVTTLSDERGRPTVTTLVADCGARVYPVGRLDMDSEGLLLLTNDGELTLRLTHPRHEIPKIYHVTLRGEVSDTDIVALQNVRKIDDYELAPVGIRLLSRGGGKTLVEFTLYEGRNRQIRKMCEAVSLRITQLRRVAIGELKLGDLPLGKWRNLTQTQIDYLYQKKEDEK